jgi:hypothetical protein
MAIKNTQRNQTMTDREALEQISLYLSQGISDYKTTAEEYKDRIMKGIDNLLEKQRIMFADRLKEIRNIRVK